MMAQVQKWGNSLALRIPKAFAEEASIANGTQVELSLRQGSLVVHPVVPQKFDFFTLLAGITPDNVHDECDTGEPVGKEML